MPRNNWNKEISTMAREAIRKGEITADKTDEGIQLQMSPGFEQTMTNTISQYIQAILSRFSAGVFPPMSALQGNNIVPYYVPLDIDYSPPMSVESSGYNLHVVASRFWLAEWFRSMNFGALYTIYTEAVKGIAGASLENVQVRPIMPIELGGSYASGQTGPLSGIPLFSGTNVRNPGNPSVSLAEGYNTNVVNINLNQPQTQTTTMLLYGIKDTTVPQNARSFIFFKNSSPMMKPDYTSNLPMLQVDWGTNSAYRPYTEIGLVSPIFLKPGDSFNANVYAVATATENLIFEGFIAYIGGK